MQKRSCSAVDFLTDGPPQFSILRGTRGVGHDTLVSAASHQAYDLCHVSMTCLLIVC